MILKYGSSDEMIYYIFHVLVKQVKVDNSIFCRIYIVFSWSGDSPVSIQIIYDIEFHPLPVLFPSPEYMPMTVVLSLFVLLISHRCSS